MGRAVRLRGGRASDLKARDLTPGGGGDQAPGHSGVRGLQVLDITLDSFEETSGAGGGQIHHAGRGPATGANGAGL